MAKYAAKATVYIQLESDYPDGVGEAQREIEYLVQRIKIGAAEGIGRNVEIARAIDIELLPPCLREEPGESTNKLYRDEICLDNGIR